jgi:hypothetical protein
MHCHILVHEDRGMAVVGPSPSAIRFETPPSARAGRPTTGDPVFARTEQQR